MPDTLFLNPPTLDALRARRGEILALAERHGAYNVRVFGSVARGDANEESDIDILVSFRENASIYNISGLLQDLKDLLGQNVDLVTDDAQPRHQKFMRAALKDAEPL